MIPAPAGGVQQTGRPNAVPGAVVTGTPVTHAPMKGYGQDKHETHSGRASPCVRGLARLAAGFGRQRDCLFSEAVDQVFGRKLRVL